MSSGSLYSGHPSVSSEPASALLNRNISHFGLAMPTLVENWCRSPYLQLSHNSSFRHSPGCFAYSLCWLTLVFDSDLYYQIYTMRVYYTYYVIHTKQTLPKWEDDDVKQARVVRVSGLTLIMKKTALNLTDLVSRNFTVIQRSWAIPSARNACIPSLFMPSAYSLQSTSTTSIDSTWTW